MDPTAHNPTVQGTSLPIPPMMYTPSPFLMHPMVLPQFTAFPWYGSHSKAQQGPQQHNHQTPQNYVNPNAHDSPQTPQATHNDQKHMYQQHQFGAPMTGMMLVPVFVPHPQMYQNLQGMPQYPFIGNLHPSADQNSIAEHRAQSGDQNPSGLIPNFGTNSLAYPTGVSLPNHSAVSDPKVQAQKSSQNQQKWSKVFTEQQLLKLNSRFDQSDRISEAEREKMSEEIGVTPKQIKNWFCNQRCKLRRNEKKRQLEIQKREEEERILSASVGTEDNSQEKPQE